MNNTNAILEQQAVLKAQIEALQAENAKLIAAKQSTVSLAVSEKGAVSVYGMGKFPVTLYKEQFRKILSMAGDIEAFIVANDAKLKSKSDSK